MNLHTYTPRRPLPLVPRHIDVRQGIAVGSAVGYSPDMRRQFSEWIASFKWSHFITLASNDVDLRSAQRHLVRGLRDTDRMEALAKAWEMRVNRQMLGPRWDHCNKRGERLQAFFFIERAYANPHWHVLARVEEPDPIKHMKKIDRLRDRAGPIWTGIIRSGSVDIKDIYDDGVAKYVAKELGRSVSCDRFILPGQFDPGR